MRGEREMPVADCCKLMQELFAFVFLRRVTLISSHLSAPALKKNSHCRFLSFLLPSQNSCAFNSP